MSVEVKRARRKKNNSAEVDPVSNPRKNDDLIAIIINDKYVLIEPMEHHLKACSSKGTRPLTKLFNG